MAFLRRTGKFLAGRTELATAWPCSFIFFKWLVLCLVFSTVYEILIEYFNLSLPETNFGEYIKLDPMLAIIATLLIAPPFEELVFRLPLRKNRFYGWSVFFLLIIAATLWGQPLFFYPVAGYIILLAVYQNYLPTREFLFPVIIVSSIIFFGAIHLTNYDTADIRQLSPLAVPLVFLPQLFAGIALTVVRLTISFRHAILLHISYNAIVVGLALIFEEV